MELLVDSGAVASILNYRTFKALLQTPRLGRSITELTSYTGQAITVLGQTKASVICGNTRILDFDFVVVEEKDNFMEIYLLDALGFSLQRTTDRKKCAANIEAVHCTQASEYLLCRYPNLLQPPTTIKEFVHKPAIDRTVRPRSQPYRRVPIALGDSVNKK